MSASRSTSPSAGFSALGLADNLVAAVAALGYEEATPVQRETIPLLLSGRDMLAQATRQVFGDSALQSAGAEGEIDRRDYQLGFLMEKTKLER